MILEESRKGALSHWTEFNACDKGKIPLHPLTNSIPRLYFDKSKWRAKAKWLFIIFQWRRLVEVMGVVPLLLLHIDLVKNWYATITAKSKTTQKSGIRFTSLYAPENTSPDLLNRQNLWNKVEQVERRKDALLAREFEIAFPQELNQEQRKKMLNELCSDLVKKYGVVVDAAIHAPHTDGRSDARNYHAHIMFTTRVYRPRKRWIFRKNIGISVVTTGLKQLAIGESISQC